MNFPSPETSQNKLSLTADNLNKNFGKKNIFKNLNISLKANDSLSITGKNGSGKSTLIKILAGILNQSSGDIKLTEGDKIISKQNFYRYIGLVSPYLNLYDEFSAYENLQMVAKVRGISEDLINPAIERVGLFSRRNDLVKIYSSGMRQRLNLAFSVLHNPFLLFLDEPTSNLDAEGIKLVEEIADEFKKNKILIIATNDNFEKSLCSKDINIDNYKG